MKEFKAYIRPSFLEGTIEHLEREGVKDITVTRANVETAAYFL